MLRNSVAALLLVLALGASGPAGAFSVSLTENNAIVRWKVETVPYVIHQDGSDNISDGSDIAAIQKGFADWEAIPCSYLKFSYQGTTTNTNLIPMGYANNGANELAWIEDNRWRYGSYVLGVTSPIFYYDGQITEADIVFNGRLQTWSTNGVIGQPNFNTSDVLNVAIHEEGHFFGLQHVLGGYASNNPPTMAPQADPYLQTRSLEPDDQKAICFLYPQGGYTCQSEDDCPYIVDDGAQGEYYSAKVQCKSDGTCGGVTNELPAGNAQLGDSCSGDYDCAAPLFCQQTGQGGMCAQHCNPNQSNCPSGFDCYPYSNSPGNGVCLPGSGGSGGSQPTLDAGQPCEGSQQCTTGLCVGEAGGGGYFCRLPCNVNSPSCPAGHSCYSLVSGGVNGACIPTPGGNGGGTNPSGKQNGEVCESSHECQSGLCVGDTDGGAYTCRNKCDTTTQTGCSHGETCYGLQGGGSTGACIPSEGSTDPTQGPKPTGSPCTTSTECVTGQCVSLSGYAEPFCTAPCTTASDCPCGMGCVPTNVGNVCAPGDKVRCVPDGNPCTKDVECASEVCLNGVCALKCDIFGGGCPAGQGCLRTGQGTQGLCRPRGSGVPGAPCRAAEDCGNLLCIDMGAGGSRCAVPCNPAGGTRCGAGTACQAFEDIGICVTDPNAPSDPFGGGGGDGADGASSAGDASGGFVGGDGGGSSCGAGTPFAGPWAAGLLALLLLGGCCRRRRLSEAE